MALYSLPDIFSSPISLMPCINKGIALPFAAKFLGEAWRNEIFLSPIFIVRVDPVVIYDKFIGTCVDSPIIFAAVCPVGNILHLSRSAISLAIFSRGIGTFPNLETFGLI